MMGPALFAALPWTLLIYLWGRMVWRRRWDERARRQWFLAATFALFVATFFWTRVWLIWSAS